MTTKATNVIINALIKAYPEIVSIHGDYCRLLDTTSGVSRSIHIDNIGAIVSTLDSFLELIAEENEI